MSKFYKNPDNAFLIHVDVMPSEQIENKKNEKLCIAAVCCTNIKNQMPWFKQYKDLRQWNRRIKTSRQLNNAILKDEFKDLRVIISIAPNEIVYNDGRHYLNEIKNSKEFYKDGNGNYVFQGNKISMNRAITFSWYANILSVISGRLGRHTKEYEIEKAYFALDKLPGIKENLDFFKFLVNNTPSFYECMQQSIHDYNLNSLEIEYFTTLGGEEKKTINYILSDWFAHLGQAKYDSNNFKKGKQITFKSIKEFIIPYDSLYKSGKITENIWDFVDSKNAKYFLREYLIGKNKDEYYVDMHYPFYREQLNDMASTRKNKRN